MLGALGKALGSAVDLVTDVVPEELIKGSAFGIGFDIVEHLLGDCISTTDEGGKKDLDSMDLTNIDDVRDLMRRAAEGDEDAKELLKENSDLVQLTVQDFAAGQQLMSNLSQAFFGVDKSIIGNIRV